jgi:AAA domain/AAA domain, putative AbiEii toxin, Type IV TA system
MQAGAHFRCCDLQVHSPRDRNWKGPCPVTLEDRTEFANALVASCRTKGLQAIAITDHHDLCFFSFIRDAALRERDGAGNPIADESRLVVFPGLELTLALPCQALVIFDPTTDEATLASALGALGIESAPIAEPKTVQTAKLRFQTLDDVVTALDALPSLRGRYILLPNVNDGGDDSILRHDFGEHYKGMPCVGGYVDGAFANHGRILILDGHDPAWGNKRLGVIQTSDAREADFSRLGSIPTWVKWSVPTAEAIRQACLSPASRLCYSAPLIPDSWISSMEVSDSRYFGGFTVNFSPQLNTIIGGRGSGKSTVLEYLRWALCDQAYVHSGDEGSELPDYEKRRRSLVAGTLAPSHGTVTVHYIRHGVPHRIRREAGTNRAYLKIGENPEQEASEEVVQSLAQIQGYSQKQLSHVSVRAQELERLLTAPIAQELSNIEAEIKSHASALRQAFENCESKRSLQDQLQAIQLDLDSKAQQAAALTNAVKNLPEDQRIEIDAHPAFSDGARLVGAYGTAVNSLDTAVSSAAFAARKIVADLPPVGASRPNRELAEIRELVVSGTEEVAEKLRALSESVKVLKQAIEPKFQGARGAVETHNAAYGAAASENKIVQERLQSLRLLSEQISESEKDRDSIAGKMADIGDADSTLQSARNTWLEVIRRKRALLENRASVLYNDSQRKLRATIGRPQNADRLRTSIQAVIAGAAITRAEKLDSLVMEAVESSDPLETWLQIGDEMVALARTGPRLDSGAALPPTPRLKEAGFTDGELGRIARRLTPTAAFELTLLYPDSAPIFEYQVTQTAYAPFEQASPGQQATALIGLLLNQSAGPLVVDQPEDDLDNLTITEVAARLWGAKEKRQIIFSTHNPNLVVIGDAENVLHCSYAPPSGSPKLLRIADQGAIDNPAVCHVITEVMEGGKAAFSLRKEKYGF